MTNDEVRILMERILLVPVAEVDAAMVLAGIEERLRNESRPTTGAVDGARVCPECGSEIAMCMMGHYCGEKTPRH